MTRLSIKQAKELGIEMPKSSKYRARKLTIDGITFDSQKEANRYCELKLMLQAGEIAKLELQPEFILQKGYRGLDGKWVRAIKYRADFRVTYPDGRVVVIDTKGYQTKEYKLKKKLLLARYPDIYFVEE